MIENINNNNKILFIALVCSCLVSACIGPLKNISIDFLPDQYDTSSEKEKISFETVSGIACIPKLSMYETGRLIDVIDGDSIRVAINGSNFEVRYIGVNTPEYYSDQRQAAIDATKINRDLITSAEIFLFKDISETDKYDRLLRYVIANGKFINLEMVLSGHAQAKRYFPDISCQSTFEQAVD